jgi:hypothetical protein
MYNQMKRLFLDIIYFPLHFFLHVIRMGVSRLQIHNGIFPLPGAMRTLILGEDIIDNTLDNQHKFLIMATMGGVL